MMDKFVKTLKTTKRRISQQLKVATGQAEMTRDAEFDLAYRDFADLESNLKLLSSHWCDTNRKLADELLHFTMKSEVDTEDMTEYREAINNLHIALQAEYDYTRRAIICVLRSHIIVRIDGLLKQEFAAVEKVVKTRKNILTDYDSHRAKCSLYERRGDSSNADRFRVKMEHDSEMLREHSEYLRKRFAELVAVGGALLRQETATLVACEMYLLQCQNEAMATIASGFSGSSVQQVLEGLTALAERIKDGEDVEREYVPPALALPALSCAEPPVVTDYPAVSRLQASSQSSQVDSQTDKVGFQTDKANAQPMTAQQPKGTSEREPQMVRALYSLDTAVEGELAFKEGDCIEVLREDPSGWWEGRLNGKTGRFPCNYTQAC
ncbi:hypothetical protein AV274_4160 [Blastocystis sp. ATCC 50177/Nand II]|uniref:SH3 domain-containing protein n=1 Tax=Blastocystis sp. subtype 1 (strain ATCC 50177 / NandII) TaxID=478820 RepID=A0A196SDL4_BLAHN|nr:hypothetical protein AV274_4160 [Blastocystis sp. ATCC 50177/Nand II]